MPDKAIFLSIAVLAVLQTGGILAGVPYAAEAHCYVMVAVVSLGAYAAHIRQLQKLGHYDRENHDSADDGGSGS